MPVESYFSKAFILRKQIIVMHSKRPMHPFGNTLKRGILVDGVPARNLATKFDPLAKNKDRFYDINLNENKAKKALREISANSAGSKALKKLCESKRGLEFVEQMVRTDEGHKLLERLAKTPGGRSILAASNIHTLQHLAKIAKAKYK